MSISVEVKMTGDITTPEHQAAIKKIMDAVEKAVNELPGLPAGLTIKSNRYEVRSSTVSRYLTPDGLINPEPFPAATGYMQEAKMQFGFHLNPVVKPIEPVADRPDKE